MLPPILSEALLSSAVLRALDLAILEQQDDGGFRARIAVPTWFRALLPQDTDLESIPLTSIFPFLDFFLDSFASAGDHSGVYKSDLWSERDAEGMDRHLQASVIKAGGRLVVFIYSPEDEQNERNLAIQRAHDVQLQAEKIERLSRQLSAMNDELKIRNEEVERATRAKTDFLAAMSHEIRTPMNAIIGMADLLQETSLSPDQRKYVQIFQSAGENLLALINDILDLSKVESGKVELESVSFGLPDVIARATDLARVRAEAKGLQLTQRIEDNVPIDLLGDPNRLRQVIINLLGNSIKFTDRGSVDLAVRLDSTNDNDVRLHFTVTDTGIGIPPTKVESIFESFSQVDSSTTRKYGGTGLGLSISRQIVEIMGGRIWVESELGVGSRFHFTVSVRVSLEPSVAKDTEAGRKSNTGQQQARSDLQPGLRILLADDSEDNRFLILSYLRGSACTIETAENGRIAFDKFRSGTYNLVLMDVEMPEMDGYTAVRKIRQFEGQSTTPTPVLALTAHAFPEAIAKSVEAGFTEHLTKPIRRSTLLAAINRYAISPAAEALDQVLVDPMLLDLVPRFLEKRRDDVATLAQANAAGDYDAIRRLGHNLKGTGTSYGFRTISAIGESIEEAAKIHDAASVSSKVQELSTYLNSVKWSAALSSSEE